MRSGKNGQADNLHIFLKRRVDDHFRRLTEARVDDLHTGIPQRPGDYLGASVVAVEAGFGDQDPDSMIHKWLQSETSDTPLLPTRHQRCILTQRISRLNPYWLAARRYSPGATPSTRLKALWNAPSES